MSSLLGGSQGTGNSGMDLVSQLHQPQQQTFQQPLAPLPTPQIYQPPLGMGMGMGNLQQFPALQQILQLLGGMR